MAKKQTAGRDRLGKLAPQFAALNDDVLFGEVWSREEQLSAREAEVLVRAVRKGLAMDLDDLPAVPRRRERVSAEVEGAVDLMYALLRIVADREDVAPQVIATRDDLLDLATGHRGCRLASGWRHELAGSLLERLLAGEIGLTVKEGRVEVL